MKYLTLKLAVIGSLGFASGLVMADWENLPSTGVPVSGGTSAYITCNPTGNFGSGSGPDVPVNPSSNNDTCARMVASDTAVPDPNFTFPSSVPIAQATRPVVMNNDYTQNTPITVGEVKEIVWRRSTGGGNYECIYAMKVNLFGVDYNLEEDGDQYFEVNDMARAGWTGLDVDVAYSTFPAVAEPTYRIGRTFTAVQHRGTGPNPDTGYVAQPLTPGSTASINGVNVWPTPTGRPYPAEQTAQLDTNWIDFTTDVNYLDDDGSTSASSGQYYVRTTCANVALTTHDEAIRLRQTFQEKSGGVDSADNSFIEVAVKGYMPIGGSGSAEPEHTDPY